MTGPYPLSKRMYQVVLEFETREDAERGIDVLQRWREGKNFFPGTPPWNIEDPEGWFHIYNCLLDFRRPVEPDSKLTYEGVLNAFLKG